MGGPGHNRGAVRVAYRPRTAKGKTVAGQGSRTQHCGPIYICTSTFKCGAPCTPCSSAPTLRGSTGHCTVHLPRAPAACSRPRCHQRSPPSPIPWGAPGTSTFPNHPAALAWQCGTVRCALFLPPTPASSPTTLQLRSGLAGQYRALHCTPPRAPTAAAACEPMDACILLQQPCTFSIETCLPTHQTCLPIHPHATRTPTNEALVLWYLTTFGHQMRAWMPPQYQY